MTQSDKGHLTNADLADLIAQNGFFPIQSMSDVNYQHAKDQIIAALRQSEVGIHISPGVEDAHISGSRIEGNIIHHSGGGIRVDAPDLERKPSSDKVLVPREPTMEMRKAGRDAMPVEYEYWQEGKILHSKIKPLNDCVQPETIYRAMLSASEAEGHHE